MPTVMVHTPRSGAYPTLRLAFTHRHGNLSSRRSRLRRRCAPVQALLRGEDERGGSGGATEGRDGSGATDPRLATAWPRRPVLESLAMMSLAACVAEGALTPRRARAAGSGRPLAVVTGACGGIGGEVGKGLVAQGYDVVCACRTVEQGRETATRMNARCLEVPCDLADLRSVRTFSSALLADERARDGDVALLVLAAGMVGPPLSVGRTQQGHELNFGVNHLGHFHLTQCLRPALCASAHGARVVSLTSTAALDVPVLRLDDVDWTARARSHSPHLAYCESKAMNVLFVDELARRDLEAEVGAAGGGRVSAYAVHPGPTATVGGVRYELPKRYAQRLQMTEEQLRRQAAQLGIRNAEEAAAGPLWLAAAEPDRLVNGGFYTDAERLYSGPVPTWRTADAAERLWQLSAELCADFQ